MWLRWAVSNRVTGRTTLTYRPPSLTAGPRTEDLPALRAKNRRVTGTQQPSALNAACYLGMSNESRTRE